MPGRNIYDTIGLAVDNVFVNFLSRPSVKQPILTQYCDGIKYLEFMLQYQGLPNYKFKLYNIYK